MGVNPSTLLKKQTDTAKKEYHSKVSVSRSRKKNNNNKKQKPETNSAIINLKTTASRFLNVWRWYCRKQIGVPHDINFVVPPTSPFAPLHPPPTHLGRFANSYFFDVFNKLIKTMSYFFHWLFYIDAFATLYWSLHVTLYWSLHFPNQSIWIQDMHGHISLNRPWNAG